MKKNIFRIILASLFLATIIYVTYNLLTSDGVYSIPSIIRQAHHFTNIQHLLILGLLPVYISAIIFSIGLLVIFLGKKLGFSLNIKNNS